MKIYSLIPIIVTTCVMIISSFVFPTFFAGYPFSFIGLSAILYSAIKIYVTPATYFKKENTSLKTQAPSPSPTPQVSTFTPILSFTELLKSTHEEARNYLKGTSPSAISLFVNLPGKANRYPVALETFINFEKLNSLQFFKLPVTSLPQKKTHYFWLQTKIILNDLKQKTDLQNLDIKGGDLNQSYLNLFFVTSMLITVYPKKDRNIPFLVPLPEMILAHSQTRKIFLDLLTHSQFPHHLCVFLVSKEMVKNEEEGLISLHKKGIRFALIMNDFNTTSPDFINITCISQGDIEKQLGGMARRLANHLLQTFSEQPQKIILSHVDNLQFLQDILPTQFDYTFGTVFGQEKQI